MKKENFNHLSTEDLKKEVTSLKKELLNLRLSASSMLVKDYSQFKKFRSKVARILTFINSSNNKALNANK